MGVYDVMKDKLYTSAVAVGTGAITTILGGWDKALEILLIFIVLDYITGIGASIKNKRLRSDVGFNGIFKKGSIFLVVIVAAQLDRITGNSAALFRTSTCFFFIANEGLSILENVGEVGVKLPSFITKVLEKLRDTNDKLPNEQEERADDTND